jgi:hypothetical protein
MSGGARRRLSRPWWRSERGQSTAMVLSMLMVFILMVAMVVNVGQAVNRKIALQLVADTGAFTGATVMAEGLNYMAYANSWMQDMWAVFTWEWFAARLAGSSCKVLQASVRLYEAQRAPFYAAFEAINRVYTAYPYMEARRISEYNVDDLFPGERRQFSFREWDPSLAAGFITCVDSPTETLGLCRDALALMEVTQVPDGTRPESNVPVSPLWLGGTERRWVSICAKQVGIIVLPLPENFSTDVWYRRSRRQTRYFVWRVQAPPTKALMFDSFFGPRAIPAMTAVGVAKPVGGEIQRGRPRYVAKMVPVSKVMTTKVTLPLLGAVGLLQDPDIGARHVTH